MPVTFPNLVISFKSTLREFLAGFFDGTEHSINGVAYTFPLAKIVFDIHYLQSPIDLTIALIGSGSDNRRVYKRDHPTAPGLAKKLHGIEVHEDITRTLIIACANQKGTDKNRKTIDEAWGLLFALLETRYTELADLGIIRPSIPVSPIDDTPREDIVEASGIFTCEVKASFARYEL